MHCPIPTLHWTIAQKAIKTLSVWDKILLECGTEMFPLRMRQTLHKGFLKDIFGGWESPFLIWWMRGESGITRVAMFVDTNQLLLSNQQLLLPKSLNSTLRWNHEDHQVGENLAKEIAKWFFCSRQVVLRVTLVVGAGRGNSPRPLFNRPPTLLNYPNNSTRNNYIQTNWKNCMYEQFLCFGHFSYDSASIRFPLDQ